MTSSIQENFDGDLGVALRASINSPITSPTTKALLEWVQGELDRLNAKIDHLDNMLYEGQDYLDFEAEYPVIHDDGDNYTGPTFMEYDD